MRFYEPLHLLNELNLEWYEHKPKHVIPCRFVEHYAVNLVNVLHVPREQAEWVVYWMSVLTWSRSKQCSLNHWIEERGDNPNPNYTLDTFCHWESSLLKANLMCIMARGKEWR